MCNFLTLLRVLCVFDTAVVQLTLVSQSQSALQENKLRGLRIGLEKLNQSYQLLFSQYPALNQYCPVSNATTGGESVRIFIQNYKCEEKKTFFTPTKSQLFEDVPVTVPRTHCVCFQAFLWPDFKTDASVDNWVVLV